MTASTLVGVGSWRWHVSRSSLSPFAKLILHTLALHIDASGRGSFPGLRELERLCSLSRQSVCRYMAEAEAAGWLVVHRAKTGGAWDRNQYQLAHPAAVPMGQAAAAGGSPEEPGVVPIGNHLPIENPSSSPSSADRVRTRQARGDSSAPVKVAPPEYPPDFEAAWAAFPKRAGDNPKRTAWHAWRARLAAGDTAEDMAAGVARFAAYCRGTGKVGTEYVMQAQRFFGPSRPFAQDWRLPKAEGRVVPHDPPARAWCPRHPGVAMDRGTCHACRREAEANPTGGLNP